MDDHEGRKHEQNGSDEISRIYNEIEKEFQSSVNQEYKSENLFAAENTVSNIKPADTFSSSEYPPSTNQPPHPEHIDNETPSPVSVEFSVEKTADPVFGSMPAREAPVFYSETIKNEDIKKEKRKFNRTIAAAVAICLIGGSLIGYNVGKNNGTDTTVVQITETEKGSAEQSKASAKETTEKITAESATESFFKTGSSASDVDIQDVSDMFVSVVEKVEPSVVAITTLEESTNNFFNVPTERNTGSGSGVIFHEDDDKVYVLTNAHVVSSANAVKVSIEESEGIGAKLVGADTVNDIAVISMLKSDVEAAEVKKVTVAEFGNSDKLKVGEIVLAIGNAFGQGNSATMGIISTKEKEITVSEGSAPLKVIQTNATINFGNSGGPLVNLDGEIIGINTAKLSPAYGAEGMGYSIGINRIKPIVEDLMTRTNKPFLGIQGTTITAEISEMYSLPEAGVFVNGVFENSSAEKAGIKRTDIVTAIDDTPIFTWEELAETIKGHNIGDKIKISIIREGKTPMTVVATLEKYDDLDF